MPFMWHSRRGFPNRKRAPKNLDLIVRVPVVLTPKCLGGPTRSPTARTIVNPGVHSAKQLVDHPMGVGRVPRAHLLDRHREQPGPVEDVGALGKKAKISRAMK
jgi:hypothetical protein